MITNAIVDKIINTNKRQNILTNKKSKATTNKTINTNKK